MAVIKSGASSDELTVDVTSKAARTSIYDTAGDSCMDNTNNAVRVNLVAGAGSGGTASVDDSAFTPGTTSLTPTGYVADEVTPDPIDEGDVGTPRMSLNRVAYAILRDAAGNERGANVTAANALVVDGSASTQPVSGTVTANAGSGPFPVSDNGGSLTVDGSVTVASLPASTNTIEVVGDAAHDAAVAGNPVLIGLEGRTTDGVPVTAGDAVRALADTLGKQVVLKGSINALARSGTANFTTTTPADIIAAAGAGISIVVTSILVTNAHATVGTKVTIRDGTTAKVVGYAVSAGGGFALTLGGNPIFVGTANTAITAVCGTTGSDIDVSISGYLITN